MKTRTLRPLVVFLLPLAMLAMLGACGGSSSSSDDGGGNGDTGTVGGTSGTLRSGDGSPVAGAAVAITTSGSSSLTKAALRNSNGRYLKLPRVTDDDGDDCEDISSSVSGTIVASDCTSADGAYTLTGEIPCGSSVTFSAKKGTFFVQLSITLTCTDSDSDGDFTDETVAIEDDIEFSDDCGVEDDEDDDADCDVTCSGEGEGDFTCQQAVDNGELACDDGSVSCFACVDGCCEESEASEDDDEDEDESVSASGSSKKRNGDDEDEDEDEDDDCQFDNSNMAVVTGSFDEIQNVLAKLGFGEVDDLGELDTDEAFDFTLVDGNFGLDDETYDNADDFFSSAANLADYDIIFINCGTSYESDVLTDASTLAILQDYVNDGGRLYVTDLSYDYIEQSFPSFMDFLGNGTDANTAETMGTAQVGTSGISTNATVNDETMADWLDGVTVNAGSIDDDCSSVADADINRTTGARNSDGTVTIADFLSGWAVMDAAHTGVSPTIWIQGPVDYSGGSDVVEPLTVTSDQGDGSLLYSSYHTAHSCPTQGFWPQERILQYLVFEL